MYYFIKGRIIKKGESNIVLDNNGIGYYIYTSASSLNGAGELGDITTMYTYLHVREDVFDLYGFTTEEEKGMFLHLLSVSGVGPKAALAVLSEANPAKLALAIITNDVKTITKAQGVGPKMAQRIILDLKDKLMNADLALPDDDTEVITDDIGNAGEAVSALVVLGYKPNDAKKAVAAGDQIGSIEDIIIRALAKLM